MNTTHSLHNLAAPSAPMLPFPVGMDFNIERLDIDEDDEALKVLECFEERCHNEERKRRANIFRRKQSAMDREFR